MPTRDKILKGAHSALRTLLLALIAFTATAGQSVHAERYVRKLALPSGQTAVIAEGEFEARSLGSFSVRLYQAASAADATTFFITGLIRPRDGTVEAVYLEDVDGVDPQQPEIVVIVRSVGSGGYLSAEAFSFGPRQLELVARVEGLLPRVDPIPVLRDTVANR